MFKPRLRRLDWLYTPYPVYFITACTHGRRPLLAQQSVHQALVAFCAQAAERNVAVGRYVLMPDHLHLFVAFPPGGPKLSEWVKGLKRAVAIALKGAGVVGPYWQKGFFDHVLRSVESSSRKWAYVRENPVRAGLVVKASEWPYQGEIYRLRL
jgi:putative transposase